MRLFLSSIFIACAFLAQAQISGYVYGLEDGKKTPLPGASVFWDNTTIGTTTNDQGYFSIEKAPNSNKLGVSYIGYKTQYSLIISRKGTLNFTLKPEGASLEAVDVIGERDATAVDLKSAGFTLNMDDKELRKAACCNISESFETNASVDATFTDAVTGQKQIEMLGLAGKYALIQRENIPFARGINASRGLSYMPGPFVEGLQLTKGLSSVLNGYESITGQINVEYVKPNTAPRLLLNAFGSDGGRAELNTVISFPIADHMSSSWLVHGSTIPIAQDRNDDGFADIPLGQQLNISNRYQWESENHRWEGQFGFSLINDEKQGGQLGFIENDAQDEWGYNSNDERYEVFGKTGYLFPNSDTKSLGFIYNASYQKHTSNFGNSFHEGEQLSAYVNSIYQDVFGDLRHTYRTGLSLQFDDVRDSMFSAPYASSLQSSYRSSRIEVVPGAFFEYVYEPSNELTLVSGIRADYNSLFNQVFFTPRLNLRYMPAEQTTLRIGGGRGQRTPFVAGENLSVLASNRLVDFSGVDQLLPEIAWNTGASISQNIEIGERLLRLNIDGFFTWFDTKLVADLDANAQRAILLLNEGSRSFSLLGQVDYSLFKGFDVRLAYKYLNAQERFVNGLDFSYRMPNHRAFLNLAYATENNWKFDLTTNWFGSKRLPNSNDMPVAFQQAERSPDFFTVNAQINKTFKNGLEVFVGGDNLLNFRQSNPIVNAQNPFSAYFDSNFVWGPIFGRNLYAGLYYRIPQKKREHNDH
jgi:outer membrane receptor for ferrienterochelin and colicins